MKDSLRVQRTPKSMDEFSQKAATWILCGRWPPKKMRYKVEQWWILASYLEPKPWTPLSSCYPRCPTWPFFCWEIWFPTHSPVNIFRLLQSIASSIMWNQTISPRMRTPSNDPSSKMIFSTLISKISNRNLFRSSQHETLLQEEILRWIKTTVNFNTILITTMNTDTFHCFLAEDSTSILTIHLRGLQADPIIHITFNGTTAIIPTTSSIHFSIQIFRIVSHQMEWIWIIFEATRTASIRKWIIQIHWLRETFFPIQFF